MNARAVAALMPLAMLAMITACSSGTTPIDEGADAQPITGAPQSEETPIVPVTYIVGTDIQPGLYRGDAGQDWFDLCYWTRLRDLSGQPDSIVVTFAPIGQFYFEVAETDYAVETTCELEFLPALPQPLAEFPQTIQPGTYLVGIEIQAGTYQGQAGQDVDQSCYWARCRGLSGWVDAIIDNENSTGQFSVQVAPSDVALETWCELTRTGP